MFNNKSFTKRVLFVGIPDMAYICLDGLLMADINIVGVIGAKKDHATYDSFKSFVKQRELNFIEFDKLDDPDFIKKIRGLNADVAVVCSFNYKVPKVLLDSVKDGFINVHPSLLPAYRGANPYSSVIINDEKETGVTLHYMDEGFDTGDIIFQKKLPISPAETMGTIFNRLNILSVNMLVEVLKVYENDDLPRTKQPQGEFVKCEIGSDKMFFINYEKTANEIERFVRSLNPFLIATTNFRQNMVKVYATEAYEDSSFENNVCGTIVKIEKDKFYVATKKGLIAPTVVQFGSFFVGTSKDFIKILDPKVGEMFL